LEKNPKARRRSQLTVIVIVLIALIGVLVVNTDRAGALKKSDEATTSVASVQSHDAPMREESDSGFYSSTMPSLLKLVSALVIVIVCIYAGVYLLKRLMGKRYSGNGQHNLLEVLETTYVAPKKSVSLLRVADKSVLVGISENQMTVLTELDRDQTREVLAALESRPDSESFRNAFKTATDKIKEIGFRKAKKAALET
jgi:flagellar biosynthetic protein FliO